ncbi:MAG TPA: hypothetical protein GX506_07325 [Firmicutes bacterium]|nr:hypothetical protein [Bacillota bacterium]
MQVKLINAKGEVMLLPEEMAVEGWPSEMDLPGTKIQGRHGRIIDMPIASLNSRTIRVSGTMAGVDKDDADAIREMVVGFVHRANPLKLYRHEGATRYINVYKKSVDHSYKAGYFGGRLFTLNITFEAADPFFYSDIQQVVHAITASPASWMVTQPGTVERQQPLVYLKAMGQLVKPSLTSTEGILAMLNDTVPAGMALVWNGETREAFITDGDLAYYLYRWGLTTEPGQAPTVETNVVSKMNNAWLLYGWTLVSGTNSIQYADDPTSTHQAEVTVAWCPRYY